MSPSQLRGCSSSQKYHLLEVLDRDAADAVVGSTPERSLMHLMTNGRLRGLDQLAMHPISDKRSHVHGRCEKAPGAWPVALQRLSRWNVRFWEIPGAAPMSANWPIVLVHGPRRNTANAAKLTVDFVGRIGQADRCILA